VRRKGKKLARVARLWANDQIHHPDPDEPDPDAPEQAATTVDALAQWGLVPIAPDATPDAAPPVPIAPARPVVTVWPCNLPTYNLWCRCQTQWRVGGMAGRKTGFDYAGVDVVMRRMGIPPKEQDQRFAELQAMEVAAINVWAQQSEAG
jgi:hypothetical protein